VVFFCFLPNAQSAHEFHIALQVTAATHITQFRANTVNTALNFQLGRKQVLPCEAENDVAERRLLMERKFFGLTMADVTCLAYQLAVRNGIKNQFCKRNEKAGKISYVVIHKFQLDLLKVIHSQERGVSLLKQ